MRITTEERRRDVRQPDGARTVAQLIEPEDLDLIQCFVRQREGGRRWAEANRDVDIECSILIGLHVGKQRVSAVLVTGVISRLRRAGELVEQIRDALLTFTDSPI